MDAKAGLDLNDVALLVRVVQTRSFSAAARERGVPVSTVSRRIARLESALGTRLLERTTRALRLTDAGRTYFEHASRAMDDLAHGTGQLRERQAEPQGRVRILAPTWLADSVCDVLVAYLAEHPRVTLDLELDQRSADPGAFDVSIVVGKLADTSDFVARDIWPGAPKLLFASPRYLRARGAPVRFADLARHDLLTTGSIQGFATWTLTSARTKRRHTFEPRVHSSEIGVVHRAAIAGLGITMLPEILCLEDLAKKRLVRVLPGWEGERGGVHLLYRAHRSLTVAVRSCVDRLLVELPRADPARARVPRGASPR